MVQEGVTEAWAKTSKKKGLGDVTRCGAEGNVFGGMRGMKLGKYRGYVSMHAQSNLTPKFGTTDDRGMTCPFLAA